MPTLVVGMFSRGSTCPRQAWAWHPRSESRVFQRTANSVLLTHQATLPIQGETGSEPFFSSRLLRLASPRRIMGCMTDATGGQIDTRIEIVTPENIAFQYRVAGPFRRLPAFLIDVAIRVGVAIVGMIAFMLASRSAGVVGPGFGLGLLLWFGLTWFYGGLFEALWNGQTPGKRLLASASFRSRASRSPRFRPSCETSSAWSMPCRCGSFTSGRSR